jgi:phytoene desaturase
LIKQDSSIGIIGAGFSGLSAASYLAKEGFKVELFEKNNLTGGRAGIIKEQGFLFDKGPSWYWMPDVFDYFFSHFGKKASDYYQLKRLNPSYKVFWGKNDFFNIPADYNDFKDLMESVEKGSSVKLEVFLKEAEFKYYNGVFNLAMQPGVSITEFFDKSVLNYIFKYDLFQSFSSHLKKFFKNPRLLQIMEFPVLFLGALPEKTPALYSLMNYADIKLGTWYPMGGMYKITEALTSLAKELGVDIKTNHPVDEIITVGNKAIGIYSNEKVYKTDAIVSSADYNHTEEKLIKNKTQRNYTAEYWDKRTFAPSCLIFFLGISKKLKNLEHHNLFFDKPFKPHAQDIYVNKRWPDEPLFYVCCPSKTDPEVAPEGYENLFILMPVAPGIEDTEALRETYFKSLIRRMEEITEEDISQYIIYKKSYAHNNFIADYNAYKGNAYGLANTLSQTAILKPSIQNKSIKNLFYTGQLTVPGPGVPPSLLSGMITSRFLIQKLSDKRASKPSLSIVED